MGATVLVVEDEPSIGALVRTYLERDGYRVVWARTGEDALAEWLRHPFALTVLDVGLPGVIDGFEVCRRLAGRTRVIMLTARDEEADRVAGLELGADDYVVKPFSPRELVARVKAVLRRSAPAEVVSVGPVTLSRAAREVRCGDTEVPLTAREFELLAHLLENAGVVVTRERLLEEVWGFQSAGATRTVEQHVAQVRRKLGAADVIRTVRGVGYKAVA